MVNLLTHYPEFDHYVVRRVLGEGGMGVVYEAVDRRTELQVAVKVMSKSRLSDPVLQHRFLKENQILSALNHRNIVRCIEITRTRAGDPSIVMEYLDGIDFRSFEGRPYPELLPLMIQAVMGVAYLKERNILHRDLSSNNILVVLENQKRLVKIVDFGVAKILHQEGDFHTQTGAFLGKFGFAAPELFLSGTADWRSDVYSLGVIFHRLLTKRSPVHVEHAGNFYEWVNAHQKPPALAIETPPGCPPLPESLREILRGMLAPDPAERPSHDRLIASLDWVRRETVRRGLEPDAALLMTLPAAREPADGDDADTDTDPVSRPPALAGAAAAAAKPEGSDAAGAPAADPGLLVDETERFQEVLAKLVAKPPVSVAPPPRPAPPAPRPPAQRPVPVAPAPAPRSSEERRSPRPARPAAPTPARPSAPPMDDDLRHRAKVAFLAASGILLLAGLLWVLWLLLGARAASSAGPARRPGPASAAEPGSRGTPGGGRVV